MMWGKKMLLKFVTRFAVILFAVIALTAIGIHFFFSSNTTTFWIMMMPIILGIPIVASVVLATDEELSAV